MADVQETRNALWRRDEQLQRWNLSETNKESSDAKHVDNTKVKFQDGCVFLAACSSGDTDEVEKLIAKGADINTSNIDGLTALHQACIDDDIDMVEFLVERGADVNACDNEGWTALHATASCGFMEVARYLIDHVADIASVNNDGDLAIDLAESDEMEELLQEEMDKHGVDAETARNEEEELMLKDANQWLNTKSFSETVHPKTGATALHVAAAKGYIKVMQLLVQAGADIDAKDTDGWTPLHAAAHWGQEEACKILVDNWCNMDIRNKSSQTALDIADPDLEPLLEELKKKQATLRRDRVEKIGDRVKSPDNAQPMKRRSSVTRMSGDQKQNLVQKTLEEERDILRSTPLMEDAATDESSPATTPDSVSDSETEKRNEKNNEKNRLQTDPETELSQNKDKRAINKLPLGRSVSVPPKSSISRQVPTFPPRPPFTRAESDKTSEGPASWRQGLRKTGSSSAVPDTAINKEPEKLPRSASSSVIGDKNLLDDGSRRVQSAVEPESTDNKRPMNTTRSSWSSWSARGDASASEVNKMPVSSSSVAGSRVSTTVPSLVSTLPTTTTSSSVSSTYQSYTRLPYRPHSAVTADKDKDVTLANDWRSRSLRTPSTTASTTTIATVPTGTTTSSTTSPSSSLNTSGGSNTNRRSYEPPKRDEEKEVERKARAKRARETRRSTQGVTKADLDLAEEMLQAAKVGVEIPLNADRTSSDDKSDKENKPENTSTSLSSTSASRRGRYIADEKKDEDQSSYRRSNRDTALTTENSNSEKEDPSQKSSAIRTRRKRESRRPTGKVTPEDMQGITNEDVKESLSNKEEEKKKEEPASRFSSSRYSEPSSSLYDSSSSRYSRADRPSSYSGSGYSRSYSSTSLPDKEVDYKKLYEEQKLENERLRKDNKRLQQELSDSKLDLEKARLKNESSRNNESSAERRERRALERKISELEEEIKHMDRLKADNTKLREENRVLTRVVSKLSK